MVKTYFDITLFSYNVLMVSCFQQLPLNLISCSFKSLTFCCPTGHSSFYTMDDYARLLPLSHYYKIFFSQFTSFFPLKFFEMK
jgi:hypothetical protein